MKCWVTLCEGCASIHDKAEDSSTHKTYPTSVNMFCKTHGDKGVLSLCLTCGQPCCSHCLMKAHRDHAAEDIDTAGDKARKRLNDIRDEMVRATGEEHVSHALKRTLTKGKELQGNFQSSITDIQTVLKELAEKVDAVSYEINEKLSADIKSLERMEAGVSNFTQSKKLLQDHLSYLTEEASSPEVVAGEKELPKYDRSTYKQMISKQVIELPELGSTLSDVRAQLVTCTDDLNFAFTKHHINEEPYLQQDVKCETTDSIDEAAFGFESFPVEMYHTDSW